MQLSPLASTLQSSIQGNMTADAASTEADSARFKSMLDDLQQKAGAAGRPDHIVNTASTDKQDKALKEACKGFEAMFLGMMYKAMRQTVPEDKLFGESNGQKIFQDMRDEELMKSVAESGGVGLADMMYRQLTIQTTGKKAGAAYVAQGASSHAAPHLDQKQ